jgi:hypothetical protein
MISLSNQHEFSPIDLGRDAATIQLRRQKIITANRFNSYNGAIKIRLAMRYPISRAALACEQISQDFHVVSLPIFSNKMNAHANPGDSERDFANNHDERKNQRCLACCFNLHMSPHFQKRITVKCKCQALFLEIIYLTSLTDFNIIFKFEPHANYRQPLTLSELAGIVSFMFLL